MKSATKLRHSLCYVHVNIARDDLKEVLNYEKRKYLDINIVNKQHIHYT